MNKKPPAEVKALFDSLSPVQRNKLLRLRSLIFEVASVTEGVGELEETLKWGEPAYLTTQSKSGSTVRIGYKKSDPTRYAIYFNCRTDLVHRFRTALPSAFHYEGNRAIVFSECDSIPEDELRICLSMALTYHRHK